MTVLIPCQSVGTLNESGWPRSLTRPKFQASRPLSSPPPRNRRRRSTRRKRKLDLWGSSRGRRHPTRTKNVVCVDHGDGHPDAHCFRRFCDVPALQFEWRRVSRIFSSLKRKERATFQGLIRSPWTIVDLAPFKTNIFNKQFKRNEELLLTRELFFSLTGPRWRKVPLVLITDVFICTQKRVIRDCYILDSSDIIKKKKEKKNNNILSIGSIVDDT